ncbi:hypothetical protein B808_913 [Fructilactobacillus florum 8D]|uniref:Uncharacterized protein n=1 Tax=Fructilactobacillus florum 8D TaxID=1221538 RepID=W9EFU6_9LACO|nr:hypothetical protein B808_913 [Fructilactobacillus florum 8D]
MQPKKHFKIRVCQKLSSAAVGESFFSLKSPIATVNVLK